MVLDVAGQVHGAGAVHGAMHFHVAVDDVQVVFPVLQTKRIHRWFEQARVVIMFSFFLFFFVVVIVHVSEKWCCFCFSLMNLVFTL